MVYSYYPGCTLKTKAKELDQYARRSAEKLGITLEELDDWQCCGGAYTSSKTEIATKLSSVRALEEAKQKGTALVTLCSACHNVIKQTNADIASDADMRNKVNNYLGLQEPYAGETKVIHFLELLRDEVGFEELSQKIVNPLTGRKIAAYYGCLLLRPGKVMAMDDPENPKILEDFIAALGATPVRYAMRNECCGGYVTLENRTFSDKKSAMVTKHASEQGAEAIITACPLCLYNLKRTADASVPVIYFTELLAEALGLKAEV